MKTFSAMWSKQLGDAIKSQAIAQCPEGYPIELRSGADLDALTSVVNQGIDAHLEAVMFTEFSGDYGRRGFRFTPETLPVLVRRLMETGSDVQSLAFGICETLGSELV